VGLLTATSLSIRAHSRKAQQPHPRVPRSRLLPVFLTNNYEIANYYYPAACSRRGISY
jgi:hypothetical protein